MLNGQELLELLTEKFGKFPDEVPALSVIAGGAIANILYNQKHNENAPVNDIDIFTFEENETPDDKNLDGAADPYMGEITGAENNIKILETTRNGIFNIIRVKVDRLLPVEILCTQLLQRFDINATMAGITLTSSPKLITLSDYDQFLETKQLTCVNPNTPVKTMLRLLKKQKEFNCYLDPRHLESIYQFVRFNNHKMTTETVDKFRPQIDSLKEFFKVYKMKGEIWKVFLKKEPLKLHRNEKKIMKSSSKKVLLKILMLISKNLNLMINTYLLDLIKES